MNSVGKLPKNHTLNPSTGGLFTWICCGPMRVLKATPVVLTEVGKFNIHIIISLGDFRRQKSNSEISSYASSYFICIYILYIYIYIFKLCVYVCVAEVVAQMCPTLHSPWTIACKAPLSMEFSRQESWSGLPFPCLGDHFDPGIKPRSPALQVDTLPSEPPGKQVSPHY